MLGKKIKYTTYNFLCNEKLKIFDSKNNFVGIGVYKNKIFKPSRLIKFIPNFPQIIYNTFLNKFIINEFKQYIYRFTEIQNESK